MKRSLTREVVIYTLYLQLKLQFSQIRESSMWTRSVPR